MLQYVKTIEICVLNSITEIKLRRLVCVLSPHARQRARPCIVQRATDWLRTPIARQKRPSLRVLKIPPHHDWDSRRIQSRNRHLRGRLMRIFYASRRKITEGFRVRVHFSVCRQFIIRTQLCQPSATKLINCNK